MAAARTLQPEFTLLRFARQAMATTFEIAMPFSTPHAHAAANAGLNVIDQLEAQLSAYRGDSELSRLNARAANGPVEVEPRFFALLEEMKSWHAESGGAFDPACGALIDAWGYFRGPPRLPSLVERQAAMRRSGLRFVSLDPIRREVRYGREGLSLNLGAVGKGYALDRAAETMATDFGVGAALLVGGRSSILAVGETPGGGGWPVRLAHPACPERTLAIVNLRSQALGTSSGAYRGLTHKGRRLSHLLDPRTGWPGEHWASASCIAPTAAAADAWSTAFFLMKEEEVRSVLAERPAWGAILVPHSTPPRWLGAAAPFAPVSSAAC